MGSTCVNLELKSFVLCPCPTSRVGSIQQETDLRCSSSDPGATGMRARAQIAGQQ